MGYTIRANSHTLFLLPPSLDELVPADHLVRFICKLVDSLDLEALGFQVLKGEFGRPPYAADLFVKAFVWGHAFGVHSRRALERASYENVSLMWLLGWNHPDHSSLARFFRQNKEALRKLFRRVVWVAKRSGLVGQSVYAVDGTKIQSQASTEKAWHRGKLEKEWEALEAATEAEMVAWEAAEEAGERYELPENLRDVGEQQKAIQRAMTELKEVEREHLHPAEREARVMKVRKAGLALAYNAQVVSDAKNQLIVAADVVNDENDSGQLVHMIEEAVENVGGAPEETVADSGYMSGKALSMAEELGYSVVVAIRKETGEGKKHHRAQFKYDPSRDVVVCPEAKELGFERIKDRGEGREECRLYRCRNGDICPHRSECSKDPGGRSISIGPYEGAIERQKEKQQHGDKRGLLARRKVIVEPVFAQIKERMGLRRFLVRGLEAVRAEWALACTAYNLRKLHKHWLARTLVLA